MTRKKNIREQGKIRLSEYFKEINSGDSVAIVDEKTNVSYFPKRIVGKSGIVIGERGTHKIIELKDGNMSKKFIVHPINLKKLK